MISPSRAEAALRKVLPRYGMPSTAHLELVKYRENHVFRVDAGQGSSYAARLHRLGYRTAGQLSTEAAYLMELAERGLSVPRLIRTLDGQLNCTVEIEDGNTVVIDLQHWIPEASPMGDISEALAGSDALSGKDFQELGKELAKLHLASMAIGIPAGFDRGTWDHEGLAGAAPLWGDPAKLPCLDAEQRAKIGRAMLSLHGRMGKLSRNEAVFGVIHADLTPENVLVSAAGPVLIDFDDFGTGWHLFDLATVLFFYSAHPRLAEYRRGLEAGYLAERADVPAGFFDAWDDLLLGRGLTYLGWAAERHGDEEADFIERMVVPVVMDLVEAHLAGATPAVLGGGK